MANATLNGESINIEQDTDWQSTPGFAVLNPLDATASTVHFLHVPSKRRAITAHLIDISGGTALQTYTDLVSACDSHVAVTFVDDQSRSKSVYIMSISGQRVQNVAGATAAKKYVIRVSAELMDAT
jgi:hypothetical protein